MTKTAMQKKKQTYVSTQQVADIVKMNEDKQSTYEDKNREKLFKRKQSYFVVKFDLCKKTKNARRLNMS